MNVHIKVTHGRQTPNRTRKVFRVSPEQSVFLDGHDYCFRWHNTTSRIQYVSVVNGRKS